MASLQVIHNRSQALAMLARVITLHLDESLIAVHKPAGLLAVPGRGEAGHDNLAARVLACWSDALVVHRLDMATSGLMLFGRGKAMQRALAATFETRRVTKHYEAVVHGAVEGDSGSIEVALAADWPNRPCQIVNAVGGRPALTRWRVLGRVQGRDSASATTRLELMPVTGRTHQLRVHLQWLGHPIVGDMLYAPEPDAAARMLLHATRLELPHPSSGAWLELTCPAPF